jgi:hypothetical protein
MANQAKPHGLKFRQPVAAEDVAEGHIVVIDGRVVEAAPDPGDPGRVRVVMVRALAGVENPPDGREVVLTVPSDMRLSTAVPFEGDPRAPEQSE